MEYLNISNINQDISNVNVTTITKEEFLTNEYDSPNILKKFSKDQLNILFGRHIISQMEYDLAMFNMNKTKYLKYKMKYLLLKKKI